MNEFLMFKTSQPAGDLLASLPSLRQLYRQTGKKCIIYQALNVVGQGLPDVPQPFKNSEGQSIMMAEETFFMLKPLLLHQEYIQDFIVFKGQTIDYDLDDIRLKTFCNQPNGSINRWLFYVFPEMACDLSETWISVHSFNQGISFGKVILNFTPRYRNNWVNYFFLKDHQEILLFTGLPQEHDTFCKKWGLNIPLIKYDTFYELSCAINNCKFYMGNASMGFQIAEGLKIPRLLETFPSAPNVIPFGKNGFDFYHQQAAEYYFKKLIQ